MRMQIISPFIVASLLFSTQINAWRGPEISSLSKYSNEEIKSLSNIVKGLISLQSKKSIENEVSVVEDKPDQDLFCQKCLDVSAKARRILADASIVADFSMLPSEVCRSTTMSSELGGEYCMHMAEMFANQAIPYLQLLFLDEDVCSSIGICPNNNTRSPSSSSPREPGSTATTLQKISLISMGLLLDDGAEFLAFDKVLGELGETRICAACRVILSRLRTTLRNPMAQAAVLKILLQTCTMANRRYIHKCKKMVAKYGPVSVILLTKFVNVVDLCNVTHFCQLVEPQKSEGAYDAYA